MPASLCSASKTLPASFSGEPKEAAAFHPVSIRLANHRKGIFMTAPLLLASSVLVVVLVVALVREVRLRRALQELIRRLLGLEPRLAKEVEHTTAGHPMFAVQLIGDWVERKLLEPGPQGVRLKVDAEMALPGDVHQVWADRVSRVLEGPSGA